MHTPCLDTSGRAWSRGLRDSVHVTCRVLGCDHPIPNRASHPIHPTSAPYLRCSCANLRFPRVSEERTYRDEGARFLRFLEVCVLGAPFSQHISVGVSRRAEQRIAWAARLLQARWRGICARREVLRMRREIAQKKLDALRWKAAGKIARAWLVFKAKARVRERAVLEYKKCVRVSAYSELARTSWDARRKRATLLLPAACVAGVVARGPHSFARPSSRPAPVPCDADSSTCTPRSQAGTTPTVGVSYLICRVCWGTPETL